MRTNNINFTEYLDNCLKTLMFLKSYNKNEKFLDNIDSAIVHIDCAKQNVIEDANSRSTFFTDHKFVYMIDRIEHGNGGICGTETLVGLPLKEILKTTPREYGVRYKEWGYWPVISLYPDFLNGSNNYLYCWNDDNNQWELESI